MSSIKMSMDRATHVKKYLIIDGPHCIFVLCQDNVGARCYIVCRYMFTTLYVVYVVRSSGCIQTSFQAIFMSNSEFIDNTTVF